MYLDMGVSIVIGVPNSWMVYKGKSHLEKEKDYGYPYFRKSPYMYYFLVNGLCIYGLLVLYK